MLSYNQIMEYAQNLGESHREILLEIIKSLDEENIKTLAEELPLIPLANAVTEFFGVHTYIDGGRVLSDGEGNFKNILDRVSGWTFGKDGLTYTGEVVYNKQTIEVCIQFSPLYNEHREKLRECLEHGFERGYGAELEGMLWGLWKWGVEVSTTVEYRFLD